MAAMMASCGGQSQQNDLKFNSTVYEPVYASGFTITSASGGSSVLLTTTHPWQNSDSSNISRLLILRGGEEAPTGFDGAVIDSAASRIIAMSTSHIAMLDAVGASDAVVGVSGLPYVATASIRERLDSSADVGYEGNVNYETLAALNPDLVLLYGVSGPSIMEAKLKELHIPYYYVGEYTESHPLGKAEWTIVLSEIVGKGAEGLEYFQTTTSEYDSIKARLQLIDEHPLVMVNVPYNDTWFMPTDNSYLCRLISDAGGDYVYNGNQTDSSMPIDIESAYLLTNRSDVWLNTGSYTTMAELRTSLPKFSEVKPVVSGRVFNSTRKTIAGGGNDFFESGVVYPQRVLSDLGIIFHPELADSTPLYYYQKLE